MQFIDHIPKILDGFEAKLRARGEAEREAAAEQQREGAAEHGVHRWLHGYDSRETMREWGHLQRCLVDALERFAPGTPPILVSDRSRKTALARTLSRA